MSAGWSEREKRVIKMMQRDEHRQMKQLENYGETATTFCSIMETGGRYVSAESLSLIRKVKRQRVISREMEGEERERLFILLV